MPLNVVCPRDNKVQMQSDLNQAFNTLLELTLKLNLKSYHDSLLAGRTFMSRMIDSSDYPPS